MRRLLGLPRRIRESLGRPEQVAHGIEDGVVRLVVVHAVNDFQQALKVGGHLWQHAAGQGLHRLLGSGAVRLVVIAAQQVADTDHHGAVGSFHMHFQHAQRCADVA